MLLARPENVGTTRGVNSGDGRGGLDCGAGSFCIRAVRGGELAIAAQLEDREGFSMYDLLFRSVRANFARQIRGRRRQSCLGRARQTCVSMLGDMAAEDVFKE